MKYEEDIVLRDLRSDILFNRDIAYLRQFKNVIHTQLCRPGLSPVIFPIQSLLFSICKQRQSVF